MFVITVAPVVVMPDIASKKESIGVMPLRKKGIDPAAARTNQKRVIIIKPSLVFNSCL